MERENLVTLSLAFSYDNTTNSPQIHRLSADIKVIINRTFVEEEERKKVECPRIVWA